MRPPIDWPYLPIASKITLISRATEQGQCAHAFGCAVSTREKRASANRGIGKLFNRRTVERFEPFAVENIGDPSFLKTLAVSEEIRPVGAAERVIGIVRGEEDAVA